MTPARMRNGEGLLLPENIKTLIFVPAALARPYCSHSNKEALAKQRRAGTA